MTDITGGLVGRCASRRQGRLTDTHQLPHAVPNSLRLRSPQSTSTMPSLTLPSRMQWWWASQTHPQGRRSLQTWARSHSRGLLPHPTPASAPGGFSAAQAQQCRAISSPGCSLQDTARQCKNATAQAALPRLSRSTARPALIPTLQVHCPAVPPHQHHSALPLPDAQCGRHCALH